MKDGLDNSTIDWWRDAAPADISSPVDITHEAELDPVGPTQPRVMQGLDQRRSNTSATSSSGEGSPSTPGSSSNATNSLREYQQAAHDAIYEYFEELDGNPIIEVPTGGGKSWIIAEFIKSVLAEWPDQKILMLTHVKELIEQNHEKLVLAWDGHPPVSIYSAGLGSYDHSKPIVYAGIQSIWRKANDVGHVDLVIIDECHLVNHDPEGMYRRFLDDLTQTNPALKVIGFTATPYRTGHGPLTHGHNRIFTDIAHRVTIDQLLDLGYLSMLHPKRTESVINVDGITVRAGDFVHSELEERVNDDQLTERILDEVESFAARQHRKHWLLFCTGVEHAEAVAQALTARGITAGCITGKTPKATRAELIDDFRAGRLRALTNANVLTTGFDAPMTDLMALLRPTMSTVLYVQMMGRGMRIAPGKEDCLVLDFAGNVARHGPVNRVEPHIVNHEEGAAPTKACPECDEIVHLSTMTCPACGYEWPVQDRPQPNASASTLRIIADPISTTTWVEVDSMAASRHRKAGKPDSMRLNFAYSNGMQRASKWLAFDHSGYAATAARSLWIKLGGLMPTPTSTTNALLRSHELVKPERIRVDTRGKYPEIVGYDMGEMR